MSEYVNRLLKYKRDELVLLARNLNKELKIESPTTKKKSDLINELTEAVRFEQVKELMDMDLEKIPIKKRVKTITDEEANKKIKEMQKLQKQASKEKNDLKRSSLLKQAGKIEKDLLKFQFIGKGKDKDKKETKSKTKSKTKTSNNDKIKNIELKIQKLNNEAIKENNQNEKLKILSKVGKLQDKLLKLI